MKGNARVIDTLNRLLTDELSAADQYFIHSRMYENWGRDLLEDFLEETEERIDFYETQIELVAKVGLPNYLQSAVGELSDE